MKLKEKKRQITTTTEIFNNKPSKGVTYMQESGLIKTPLDEDELAQFLRTNPHLDKKQLGEYISKRDNNAVLSAFVKSFDFHGLRIDEALRIFLEAFRLPGEAPVIANIVEYFSGKIFQTNLYPRPKACQACVQLRIFLSKIPFYHESVVSILIY